MDKALPVTGHTYSQINFTVALGFAAVLLFFITAGGAAYSNTRIIQQNTQGIIHTHQVILALDDLLSLMKDAETGQRGYLITGDEKYLEPYNAALAHIESRLEDIERLTRANGEQTTRLPKMKEHIHTKLAELKETIDMRRVKGFDAARVIVVTDRGKNEMDALRAEIAQEQEEENVIRAQLLSETENSYHIALLTDLLTCLLGLVLSAVVAFLVRRTTLARQKEDWLQSGQVGLGKAMLGDQREERLGENVLTHLAHYLDASVGAFYVAEGGEYRRAASYGVPIDAAIVNRFSVGDGLLGQAVRDKRAFFVHNLPDGYLTMSSALGRGKPRHVVIRPVEADGIVNGVIELGFSRQPGNLAIEMLERVSQTIAVCVRSASYRSHLQNLLEETQRQAEELQTQSEELRVNNEELEEQGRALKETQAHMEQQQAELEQTNSQLEEQAQQLELQRDDLSRSKEIVQQKARELQQASQYKSDFLANMSHELRTPLNSSLILAKLLADNVAKNLTPEQVKFAQTIQSSGNDPLLLINDILDLSKIEAGHMDVRPENVALERIANQMRRLFEPLAAQKGLVLAVTLATDCPSSIETDPQRLEQILKNLLSNAIKFTEKGEVKLSIAVVGKKIAFTVSDTGIGIAPEHQQTVFEAFRQADGTINRKYGGTGLGLSISRELARLLGGEIRLDSQQGQGSSFTLSLAETYDAQATGYLTVKSTEETLPSAPLAAKAERKGRKGKTEPKTGNGIDDDRNNLESSSRVILAVEDDQSFVRILYDLAHEYGFKCLLASSAEEALEVVAHYMPSAVLLDVGLPDHSGLSVLDRMKRDPRMRHIPVHVISAADYMQTALSLGAVGYMLKPVKREQLADALMRLEKHLDKGMKRVLIVEDNEAQRDSMIRLIGSGKVQVVGVGTAAECLMQLKETTFDCMVLDLSLPDATGYALLETLSNEDEYAFPPVIVYTGHDLSIAEEQALRRYSDAIIIKGAKSPERLLDEVTLFLHQVVAELPPEQQRMIESVKGRDTLLEGRRILAVEDDVRNIYALTSIFEPLGAVMSIARNGREALEVLEKAAENPETFIDLVLMDVMMPEMDGLTATREIRKRAQWKKLPIIMLTAKAMKDDQEKCIDAGANDYMAKPIDVEKLLSLVRVWMPR